MYVLGQGIKNIWRNKFFSIASIATMSACIFLFGLIFALVLNFQAMIREAESGVTITVFFDDGITDARIEEIGTQIAARGEVSNIEYVSAEEALQQYIDEYMDGSEEAAQGLAEDNPLADSANFEIYMNDISMQGELASYIEGIDGVRKVNQSVVAANVLSDFNGLVGIISAAIIIILIGVAIFLISNTVATGIAVRSEEIAIMKLIGATDVFVRGPFVVEGVLIGLIGSVIPLIILIFLYKNIVGYITGNFEFLSNIMSFLPASTVFMYVIPIGLILGVGIGWIGSTLTVRKHLDV